MRNELPGRDDLPPGVGLRDIDPPEPIKCESCGDPLERCDVEAGNTHCDFCLTDIDPPEPIKCEPSEQEVLAVAKKMRDYTWKQSHKRSGLDAFESEHAQLYDWKCESAFRFLDLARWHLSQIK